MDINKSINFVDKNTFITGAAGNLGRLISKTFAELGSNLILVDKSKNDLKKLEKELSIYQNIKIDTFPCNLQDEKDRKKLIKNFKKTYRLDILINNAAFIGDSNLKGWNEEFSKQSISSWRNCLELNLITVFDLCQGLFQNLENTKNSKIINIASIYGHVAPDWSLYQGTDINNPSAYGSSKAGLIYLTKWLSTLSQKVRVNSISPGGIQRSQEKKFIGKYIKKTSLKRMAKEEDIMGTIVFLASDMSSYVTGQDIKVDGGFIK